MHRSSGAAYVMRGVLTRFRAGWLEIDPAARRQWLLVIAAGIAGMLALMMLLVVAAKALVSSGALAWEAPFLRSLETEGPFSFSTAVWFQTFGTDITLWILVTFTAGIAIWNGRPITGVSIVLAYLVIDPIVRIGWLSWDRARPDVLYNGVASPGFHAFPSGHTGKTFAVYGLLIALWVKSAPGWFEKIVAITLLAFIATVVPFGRMTMGVHWPSDVIAGWLLGAVWLVYLLLGLRFERRSRDRVEPVRDAATTDPAGRG